MFEVAVSREFIAQHFLIGGDWGLENHPHSHAFKLEIKLSGESLDQHQYLFDISILEKSLELVLERYRDKLLNDLPEFSDTNPSVELFCKNIFNLVKPDFASTDVDKIKVKLWEDEQAWASYEDRIR